MKRLAAGKIETGWKEKLEPITVLESENEVSAL